MLTLAYLAPRIGPDKAILAAMSVFFVMALAWVAAASRFRLFH